MPKPYLQNMKPEEIPQGTYHVARWHQSEKVWISQVEYSNEKLDVDLMVREHNDLAAARGWPSHPTPYFVWHAGLTSEDLDRYRSWEAL